MATRYYDVRPKARPKPPRLPMTVTIALSVEQMEQAGIPEDMSPDDVSYCLDRALLEDDTQLAFEVMQWIEDNEDG